MFGRKIVRQGKDKEYMDVTYASLEKYPKDYLRQLKYVKVNGTQQQYALWMVDRLQDLCCAKSQRTIEISCKDIELIFSSFMDTQMHIEPNLPEGVYHYMVNKMEASILDIVKKLND